MFIALNPKVCDNSKDCPAIAECPTGALFWDENANRISANSSLCTTCFQCEEECAVGAIRIARNESEFKEIKEEIENDPRTVSDLLVDRYGAQPIKPEFFITAEKFPRQVIESTKVCVIEFFEWDLVECLISSISIKEILGEYDLMYRKIDVKGSELCKELSVSTLPALLVFNGGDLVGKIEGFIGVDKKQELKERITTILDKIKTPKRGV
ncbi:MAG: thioredoxin domain-containing protein [Desulfobacteraceae bacterium]